jgi:hypothetical protein
MVWASSMATRNTNKGVLYHVRPRERDICFLLFAFAKANKKNKGSTKRLATGPHDGRQS